MPIYCRSEFECGRLGKIFELTIKVGSMPARKIEADVGGREGRKRQSLIKYSIG